jgi:hypothetical protein
MGWFDDVVDFVSDAADVVVDVVTDVVDVATDVVGEGAGLLVDAAGEAAHVFLPFIPDEVIDLATDTLGGVVDDVVGFAVDTVAGIGASALDVVEGVVTGDLGMIADAGLTLAGGIAFGPIGASVGQLAGNVVGAALGDGDILGAVTAGVGGLLGGPIGAAVGSTVGGLLTGGASVGSVLTSAVGAAAGSAGSWATDILGEDTVNELTGVADQVLGFGSSLTSGIQDTVVGYAAEAARTFLPTPLADMATGFLDGGRDFDAGSLGGVLGGLDDGGFGSSWGSAGGNTFFDDDVLADLGNELGGDLLGAATSIGSDLLDVDDGPSNDLLDIASERGVVGPGVGIGRDADSDDASDDASDDFDDFDAPLQMGAAAVDLTSGDDFDIDDVAVVAAPRGNNTHLSPSPNTWRRSHRKSPRRYLRLMPLRNQRTTCSRGCSA